MGAKQFYIHSFQDDYNRVVSGQRTFELVNYKWNQLIPEGLQEVQRACRGLATFLSVIMQTNSSMITMCTDSFIFYALNRIICDLKLN